MSETVEIKIDEDQEQIQISGLSNDELTLDYKTDINFSSLVSILYQKIDQKEKLKVSAEHKGENEKVNLVIETLEKIFEKFNDAIDQLEESDEVDDLPF